MKENKRKLVMVCNSCEMASCWYGEHMCWESKNAGTELKTVEYLEKKQKEHPRYWSDKKMIEIYGEPHAFGFLSRG